MTVEFNIPLGYKIEEKVKNVDICEAEKILLSRKQRYFTKAKRVDDRALLYSTHVVCPDCNSEFNANIKSELFMDQGGWLTRRVPDDIICDWASLQLSLFEDEKIRELELCRAVENLRLFECPKCGCISPKNTSYRQVTITSRKRKIRIKSEITSIEEILSLEWITSKRLVITFPIFEVVTFNFSRGTVDVKVVDSDGTTLAQRDITSSPELLKHGATYKLLTSNKLVVRTLKRMFAAVWGEELAFTGKSFSLEAMFKMTSYVGYPRNFYDCIPYVRDSFLVDKSFKSHAKQLVDSKRIDSVYKASSLPLCKSIRKIVFENPGLMFYLDEIEKMWKVISDPNLFCEFLKSANTFEFLSELHMRPRILDYLLDFVSAKGARQLCHDIRMESRDVCAYAIDYSCMSNAMRKEERERWNKKNKKGHSFARAPYYSVPMRQPDARIQDCTIDGYSFFLLRTSNEYNVASRKMSNCLSEWRQSYAPVICVKKGGKYVASISVARGVIIQAYGYDNSDIDDDPALAAVIEKWRAQYHLEWSEYDDPDELYGDFDGERYADLPF